MTDSILDLAPPPANVRVPYGDDPNQFLDLRLPSGAAPHAVVFNIHGGFWRSRYDLLHAGHFCAALAADGFAVCNVEYRRVGNPGGGWPGSLDDLRRAYNSLPQLARSYPLDLSRVVVTGHSAGGHLALCLAAYAPSVKKVVSLAGVLDPIAAFHLHLSDGAAAEFFGGPPGLVPEFYRQGNPMQLSVAARQAIVHGTSDDIVPADFSRRYAAAASARGETASLLEIPAGHFDLIDPRSAAWNAVRHAIFA